MPERSTAPRELHIREEGSCWRVSGAFLRNGSNDDFCPGAIPSADVSTLLARLVRLLQGQQHLPGLPWSYKDIIVCSDNSFCEFHHEIASVARGPAEPGSQSGTHQPWCASTYQSTQLCTVVEKKFGLQTCNTRNHTILLPHTGVCPRIQQSKERIQPSLEGGEKSSPQSYV